MLLIATTTDYIDIDVLACGALLQSFYAAQNTSASFVVNGSLNSSVTPDLANLADGMYVKNKKITNTDKLIIVDVSDTAYLQKHFNLQNVVQIYDHHYGYKKYWDNLLGAKSHIDYVGCCATLIWERIMEADLQNKINVNAINLSVAAILSNTLNLKSNVTTKRDMLALQQMQKFASVPANFAQQYFNQVTSAVLANPTQAMQVDTKTIQVNNNNIAIAQLELWDASDFVSKNLNLLISSMEGQGSNNWFVTIPSISQGINFIICKNTLLQQKLEQIIGAQFNGMVGKTQKLFLRKEIIRDLQS